MFLKSKFFKSAKSFLNNNKFSLLSYCLLVLIYYIALEAFNSILDFEGFNYLTTRLRRLADALLFAMPILFLRKKVWVCLYSIVPIAYILANAWYFRTYFTLMPMSSFTLVGNLKGLSNSIFDSMKWIDLAIVVPTILFIVYYAIFGNKVKKRSFVTSLSLSFAPIILCIGFILPSYIVHDESEYAHPFGLYRNEIMRGYRQFGFINFWIYSINQSTPVTKKEVQYVTDFLADFKTSAEDCCNLTENRHQNLIVILCESFQSWPIGLEVEGKEITPHLNSLIKETDGIIYIPKVLPQIKGGRSADAQLLLNTGLLPIELGATASLYGSNEYPSLPKALKPMGYTSVNMLTDEAQYWNQHATSMSYGFDNVIDKMRGDKPQERSDEELFKRALDSLNKMSQPFYAQLVTMSGHDPIKMNRHSDFYRLKDVSKRISNNLAITQYVDSCIYSFVEGLKRENLYDNSIIVITGDHHAVTLNEFEGRKEKKLSDLFIPIIILNSPLKYEGEKVIGQSDIYPTLLDIMGVSNYYFKGLGRSIFRKHPGGAVYMDGTSIGVISKSQEDSLQNLWKVSDILIRSNYFQKTSAHTSQ